MLNTYIKNRGITQTLIHDNNQNQFNEINWDADYDGQLANVSIHSNTNGNRENFDITLDNNDLANLLNIPSVNTPLDKRLTMDFKDEIIDPNQYQILLPESEKLMVPQERKQSYLSSPLPNEELIIPLTINEKNLYDGSKKKRKTHKTFKVYKKVKTTRPKTKSSRNAKKVSKSSRQFSLF
jgi:hypothetical protein